jgi:hypothetical protein
MIYLLNLLSISSVSYLDLQKRHEMPFSATISPHASIIGVDFRFALAFSHFHIRERIVYVTNFESAVLFRVFQCLMLGQRPMPFHRLVKS